jgi:hypothetical protein
MPRRNHRYRPKSWVRTDPERELTYEEVAVNP